jgi:hypothetical protein
MLLNGRGATVAMNFRSVDVIHRLGRKSFGACAMLREAMPRVPSPLLPQEDGAVSAFELRGLLEEIVIVIFLSC